MAGRMTAPRQILLGGMWLITRGCYERRFLMRPAEEVNEIILYCLAVAVKRHGIHLHAYCFLSDHYHLVLTDPMGNLPAFLQHLDSLIARALNGHLGRWDHFFEQGSYNAVRLLEPADVLERMAYTMANPVAAGLVRRGREWPGVRSTLDQLGTSSQVIRKPARFFRKGGPLPDEVELALSCPEGLGTVEEVRDALAKRLAEMEDDAARRLSAEGRAFLGARRAMAQSPNARPATKLPRRGSRPRVACRDPERRKQAIAWLRSFFSEYREAWDRYARGLRNTVFPAGTYWMRVAHGVPCAAAG